MRNPTNITWKENEKYCRWKGISTCPQNCISLFGTKNPEIEYEGKGFLLIDGTLYCSNVAVIVNMIKRIGKNANPLIANNLIYGELGRSEPVVPVSELGFFADIKRIKPYEQRLTDLKMRAIREFISDLDAFYEDFQKKTRNLTIE